MKYPARFRSSVAVVHVLVLGAAFGCEQSHHPQAGSESHFLESCTVDAECEALDPELSCQAGYCRSAPAAGPAEPARVGAEEADPSGADQPPTGADQPMAGTTASEAPLAAGCVSTGFPGDEFCLSPPSPEEGLQIHIGPRSYSDPAELTLWALAPGAEISGCWSFHTPNTTEVAYTEWEAVARPGMHHTHQALYAAEVADGQFEDCLDDFDDGSGQSLVATLPTVSQPRIARVPAAPENAGVGRRIPAAAPAQSFLHQFNFTDEIVLRELWLNLYFPTEAPIEYERPLRAAGGMEWIIEPNGTRLDTFTCPIESSGRLLSLSGRTTESTRRLSAWLRRGSGDRLMIMQLIGQNSYESFLYDSVSHNPPILDGEAGAYSGILALEAGDALEWQCHVVNETGGTITHVGDHGTGARCDLLGATVGTDVVCALP